MMKQGAMVMAYFDAETVERWKQLADAWLVKAKDPGTREDIYLGAEAWAIAHRSGISVEAYADREVTDAHIVTALKQVFPNAQFKDRYSY
jgi:hypothetical protein